MKIFISGGCKNGKSTYAEKLAASLLSEGSPLYYIATMRPVDNEDEKRIERHQQSRKDMNFTTLEIQENINKLIEISDGRGSFLLDSTTALLANEMFSGRSINLSASQKITDELLEVFDFADNIVVVSDYIYSDAALYDEGTENYCKGLAYIDRFCAKHCDIVIEVCYTNLIVHKGKELLKDSEALI